MISKMEKGWMDGWTDRRMGLWEGWVGRCGVTSRMVLGKGYEVLIFLISDL